MRAQLREKGAKFINWSASKGLLRTPPSARTDDDVVHLYQFLSTFAFFRQVRG